MEMKLLNQTIKTLNLGHEITLQNRDGRDIVVVVKSKSGATHHKNIIFKPSQTFEQALAETILICTQRMVYAEEIAIREKEKAESMNEKVRNFLNANATWSSAYEEAQRLVAQDSFHSIDLATDGLFLFPKIKKEEVLREYGIWLTAGFFKEMNKRNVDPNDIIGGIIRYLLAAILKRNEMPKQNAGNSVRGPLCGMTSKSADKKTLGYILGELSDYNNLLECYRKRIPDGMSGLYQNAVLSKKRHLIDELKRSGWADHFSFSEKENGSYDIKAI